MKSAIKLLGGSICAAINFSIAAQAIPIKPPEEEHAKKKHEHNEPAKTPSATTDDKSTSSNSKSPDPEGSTPPITAETPQTPAPIEHEHHHKPVSANEPERALSSSVDVVAQPATPAPIEPEVAPVSAPPTASRPQFQPQPLAAGAIDWRTANTTATINRVILQTISAAGNSPDIGRGLVRAIVHALVTVGVSHRSAIAALGHIQPSGFSNPWAVRRAVWVVGGILEREGEISPDGPVTRQTEAATEMVLADAGAAQQRSQFGGPASGGRFHSAVPSQARSPPPSIIRVPQVDHNALSLWVHQGRQTSAGTSGPSTFSPPPAVITRNRQGKLPTPIQSSALFPASPSSFAASPSQKPGPIAVGAPLPSGLLVEYNAPSTVELEANTTFRLIISSGHIIQGADFSGLQGDIRARHIPVVRVVRADMKALSDAVVVRSPSPECQEVTDRDNPTWDWGVQTNSTKKFDLDVDIYEVQNCNTIESIDHRVDNFTIRVQASSFDRLLNEWPVWKAVIASVLGIISAAGTAFGTWKWLRRDSAQAPAGTAAD